jgi:para-aminobenzoate synthetase / 4-amino-4-deoxychorismate lyase
MAAVPDRPRPDRDQGVFETLLVVDGRPIELDAHLARLAASLADLFPDRSPPDLGEEIEARARGIELGSLRGTVAPADGGGLAGKVSIREIDPELPFPSSPRTVAVHSLVLAGGLGPHKWADRSLLDAAQSRLPVDALPILVDRDGGVLEASRANAFVVRDAVLVTPPLDGRILPGITRASAIEVAVAAGLETREAAISRDDLLAADEVFLTGSVRGVERVRALDGADLATGDEVGSRIAVQLRRTWKNERFG